ncbi:MAG: LLM class flavin-dependent oxidoreductase [Rhodospirillales bacterium]
MTKSNLMHLGLLTNNSVSPHSIGAWRLPRSYRGTDFTRASYWQHVARTLERGRFDMLFLSDSSNLHDNYKNSPDGAIRYAAQFPRHDPMPLVPICAGVTDHLGIAATVSTAYALPFTLARHFATLDHLTDGRVGWNIVASAGLSEAANYGRDKAMNHDDRYEQADEFVELCCRLWDSWDPGAVLMDRDSGEFADPDKVHRVEHVGKYFRCRGPLNVMRSPQVRPMLIQAGSSPRGLQFATKYAEVQFAARGSADGMKQYRRKLNEAMKAQGRTAADLKVMWGLNVIVDETLEGAKAKQDALRSMVTVEGALALMSGHFNYDLSQLPADKPIGSLETDGIQGMVDVVTQDFGRDVTLIEAARRYGSGVGIMTVLGTPDTVVDELEELYDIGEGDGFMLLTQSLPSSIDDLVDLLVPELQRRGRFRTEYDSRTLRGHFFGNGPA